MCFLILSVIKDDSQILIIYRGVFEISGPFVDKVLTHHKNVESHHHKNNSLFRQDDLFTFYFLFVKLCALYNKSEELSSY